MAHSIVDAITSCLSLPQTWRTGGPYECTILNAMVGVSKRRKESEHEGERMEKREMARDKCRVGEKGKREGLTVLFCCCDQHHKKQLGEESHVPSLREVKAGSQAET